MSAPPQKFFVPPRYVSDGDTVWVRWDRKGAALRCTVAGAAGSHARAVNVRYGVDRWFRIEDLLVPPEDPRA